MRETIYNDIKYVIGQNAKENWNILDQAYKKNCDYICHIIGIWKYYCNFLPQ